MDRVIAMFVGPQSEEAVAKAVAREVERLPEGAVVVNRDGGGVEEVARAAAVSVGVHVGTLRRSPAVKESDVVREDAVLRLRPSVVYVTRRADERTVRFVSLARAVGADVRPLGPGHSSDWADAVLSPAAAEQVRRRSAAMSVVLMAGSRRWNELGALEADMRKLAPGSLVIEGDASGLDRYAGAMARSMGHAVLSVPAMWDYFGTSGERGNPAGYKRNAAMATVGADRLLAYPLEGPGTAHMMELAEASAIPVQEAAPPRGFRGRLAEWVHCERESYDVFIGRGRDPRSGERVGLGNRWSHRASRFPSVIETLTPEESVVLYRRWLGRALKAGEMPEARVRELHGKVLGCYCGRERACHGLPLSRAASFLSLGGSFRKGGE